MEQRLVARASLRYPRDSRRDYSAGVADLSGLTAAGLFDPALDPFLDDIALNNLKSDAQTTGYITGAAAIGTVGFTLAGQRLATALDDFGARQVVAAAPPRVDLAAGGETLDDLLQSPPIRDAGELSTVAADINRLLPPTLPQIPDGATVIPMWRSTTGGARYGVTFTWKNARGVTTTLRIHGPDSTAPVGSNAATGEVLRVKVGRRELDAAGNMHPPGIYNPNSPLFNEAAVNDVHIPWLPHD